MIRLILKLLLNSAVRALLFLCVSATVILVTPIMCVTLISVAFYGIIVMPARARLAQS